MPHIHPSAVVSPHATLAENVNIGPFCLVGGNVTLGEGCKLTSHVVLEGHVTAGKNNVFYPFTSIGHVPQDLKFKGEASSIVIGDDNIFREHVTVNPGTEGGTLETVIGSHCLFMIGVHIAHDCSVGDHVIMANNATLAGHVTVGDHCVIGGLAAVHQFVRIGEHAMIGGLSGIENDIIPFGLAIGERANLGGLNLVGLKRRGFNRDTIHAIRDSFDLIFTGDREGTLKERTAEVQEKYKHIAEVIDIIDFITKKSDRSLCMPKKKPSNTQGELA